MNESSNWTARFHFVLVSIRLSLSLSLRELKPFFPAYLVLIAFPHSHVINPHCSLSTSGEWKIKISLVVKKKMTNTTLQLGNFIYTHSLLVYVHTIELSATKPL